jgi:hypothetical protein
MGFLVSIGERAAIVIHFAKGQVVDLVLHLLDHLFVGCFPIVGFEIHPLLVDDEVIYEVTNLG